jgi:hypothetical protein
VTFKNPQKQMPVPCKSLESPASGEIGTYNTQPNSPKKLMHKPLLKNFRPCTLRDGVYN